jgi:hypothetical protein
MAETQSSSQLGHDFPCTGDKHGYPCESSDLEHFRYRGVDALLTAPQLPVEHNDAQPGIHVRRHPFGIHKTDFVCTVQDDEEQ